MRVMKGLANADVATSVTARADRPFFSVDGMQKKFARPFRWSLVAPIDVMKPLIGSTMKD